MWHMFKVKVIRANTEIAITQPRIGQFRANLAQNNLVTRYVTGDRYATNVHG